MVDINKYLETQLSLAKQRSEEKNKTKHQMVSENSIKTAEKICKKQGKIFVKSHKKVDLDESSDYITSDDEDPRAATFPLKSRLKQNLKKILDDGDTKIYNERIIRWKEDLTSALAGVNVEEPCSADICYILNGNNDAQNNHELQNGFCIPNYIWKQLYKYQRVGVKWLWELHQVQSGGLLGDEMGLGKTVQIIAFFAGLSKTDTGKWGGLGPSIIVAPATVIYQWVSHFHHWCPHLRVAVLHNSGSYVGNHNKLIRELHASHGVLMVTYAGIVKYSKELLTQKWHYIVLDEGHKIRNPETQVSKFVKKFQTPHRLLITGSPMQNSLQELWSLFDFMRPGLLGTYDAFMEFFATPITQGGYANATELQEATALEIAKALKNMITPYMLRRTKTEVQEFIKLPEKNEQVLFCNLTNEQKDLYLGYLLSETVRGILDKDSKFGNPLRARVLVALSTLRKICNHPDLYLYEAQEDSEHIDEKKFGYWKRSGKMTVVQSLLKIWQKQGHRALIFSQSRAMICLLEQYLQNHDYKYLKMDGTVSVSHRQNIIKTFNENPHYLVFLATTRVGGLGVNLTGADRVIIFDPDWNPATDSQAKERAWRIGQQKNVTVYRLLSAGTIEEKIYQRQIFKHCLGNRILIDPNQKNVLTTSTLQGLFTYEEPNHNGDTETAALFKHTKVNMKNTLKEKDSDVINLKDKASQPNDRLKKMRMMAKEISKRISKDFEDNVTKVKEDSRHRYKKKRDMIMNPPEVQEPEVNLIDDKITNVPFEKILCELDIINMHSIKGYEENLINDVLSNKDKKNTNTETEIAEQDIINDTVKTANEYTQKTLNSIEDQLQSCSSQKHKSNKRRKRNQDSTSKLEMENISKVKKIKKQHHLHTNQNDDEYVLHKLFAKAAVKNALHHDAVVGLAEKEKRYKLKEEAAKTARKAIHAIKSSFT